MSDWPPMTLVKQEHEKENTYLRLVDMFIDEVEPAIVEYVLQNRNWEVHASIEDLMALSSTSHADKSCLTTSKSPNGVHTVTMPYKELGKENDIGLVNEKKSPDTFLKPLVEQQDVCETSFDSSNRNTLKVKQQSVPKPGFKVTSNAKTNVQQISVLPFLEQYNYVKTIPLSYDRALMLIKDDVKLMVILRGPPGSGKSHLARKLLNSAGISFFEHKRHIFSSDDFFVQNNVYLFVRDLLSEAHTWNQRNVATAVRGQVSPIIVDNTNTQAWEMKVYAELAVSGGYHLEILEPDTFWLFKEKELARRNVHGVPKAKIRNMIERYERNITPEILLQNFSLRYSLSNAPPQPVCKSKWKDKISCQSNNKPKKKKNGLILNSYSSNNNNVPFSFSPDQAYSSQSASTSTYSDKKGRIDPMQQRHGQSFSLGVNQSGSKGLVSGINCHKIKTDTDCKYINDTAIEDNSVLMSPISFQNVNPLMQNSTLSTNTDHNVEKYSSDHNQKFELEYTKVTHIKKTFDFMDETRKLLAALGNSHGYKKVQHETAFQEEAITLPALPKSDFPTNDVPNSCEEPNNLCSVNTNGTLSCKEPKLNVNLVENKSIANDMIDLIIERSLKCREDKDIQNSPSSFEGNENLMEYVLVNEDLTFTYKRLNPTHIEPVHGNQSKLDKGSGGALSIQFNSDGDQLFDLDKTNIQKTDSCGYYFNTSNDKQPDKGNAFEYSNNCQKSILRNDVLQNCPEKGEKTSNSINITDTNVVKTFESSNNRNLEHKNSEEKSSGNCATTTNSNQTVTMRNMEDNANYKGLLPKPNCIVSDISVWRKSRDAIPLEANKQTEDGSNSCDNCVGTTKTRNDLAGENHEVKQIHPYHITFVSLPTSKEPEDTNNTYQKRTGKINDPNTDSIKNIRNSSDYLITSQDINSLSYNGNMTNQPNEDNSMVSNNLLTDKKGCDEGWMKVNENKDERFGKIEDKSPIFSDNTEAINVNKNIHAGECNEKSSKENCAIVLEMMESILKSMTPLCEHQNVLPSKTDTKHTLERDELKSCESANSNNTASHAILTNNLGKETSCELENEQTTELKTIQPKPPCKLPRARDQQFIVSSTQPNPEIVPASFMSWDTVSNPYESWNELISVIGTKEVTPVNLPLPQRKNLRRRKFVDSSTNTHYQDFTLVKNDDSTGIKVLIGRCRSITDGFCELKSDVSETLFLDKGTMTSEHLDSSLKSYDIAQVSNLFPHIPKKYILDMVDKCHGDVNWAVDILLDSEHSIYEITEVDSVTAENSNYNEEEEMEPLLMDKEPYSIQKQFELKNDSNISNLQEQSRIKQMLEHSVVIGKSHYSEKVLKLLKKKHPEYVIMVENSQPQENNIQENLCENKINIVSSEASKEVITEHCETGDENDTFEVVVNNDLILQLQQKFGNYNFPKLTNVMPVVKLPVSLARQLYSYIIDSLQSDIEEQQDVIEYTISQDEEVARIIQYQNEQFIPELQEIMDMEVALEVHRADQEVIKEKNKSTVAAKLSKNILLEKFPNIDPKMLMEVFHAHNYSLHDTVASLQLALGVEGSAVIPTSTTHEQKEIKMDSEFADELDLSQDAQVYRDQAASYYSLRIECLSKANEAFRSNNKAVASYYSQLAQLHKDKMAHYNSQAAACLMSSHKKGNNSLDLHFLHVSEAQVVLDIFLDETISNINEKKKTHQTIYLITGRGLRSVGGISRIKPMVLRTLNTRGILYNEVNPGMLSAFVRSTNPLSHSI